MVQTDARNDANREEPMARPRGRRQEIRLSVGFDARTHGALSALAREQDVAIAWVVRKAVSEFVARHAAGTEPELPLRRAARHESAAS